MLQYLQFLNENEKEKLDLLAVDMIDYYGNELPKSADKAEDFAKSREMKDMAMIKKIWNRAKEIQKKGIDEAVSPERIAAHQKKAESLKSECEKALKAVEKLVKNEKDPDKIEDTYDRFTDLMAGYLDHLKTAP